MMLFGAALFVTMALTSECQVLFSTASFLVNKEIKPKSTSRTGKRDVSSCQFPFIYKGVNYLSCTTTDDPDGKLWCSTKTDHLNNHIKGNFAPCSNQSIRKDPKNCVFPFIYKNVKYSECITADDPEGKLWCSTKIDNKQNHIKGNWEHCVAGPSYCAFPFIYKGDSYSGCITTNDPDGKLWCSTKTDHLNNHVKGHYDYCSPDERPVVIPTEKDCGLGLSNNVIRGQQAEPMEFPWLAAIGKKIGTEFTPFCGGTLITKQHVVSAAHCFKTTNKYTIVRLGEYNVNIDGDGAKDFEIVDTRRKGSYSSITKENDIILLKLDRPLDSYTDAIRAACLPYHLKNNRFDGEKLVVVGWGAFDNSDTTKTSVIPLKGTVSVVPLQECQKGAKLRGSSSVIDDRQLCAGTGGTDSCNGDSGGPINYLDVNKARFYIVGLVSFGSPFCGQSDYPAVYTRIGYFLDWIEENIREML